MVGTFYSDICTECLSGPLSRFCLLTNTCYDHIGYSSMLMMTEERPAPAKTRQICRNLTGAVE